MRRPRQSISNGATVIARRLSTTRISRTRCGRRTKQSDDEAWFSKPSTTNRLEGDCTMPDVDKYEILVLGSGEAGKYLAWTMAKEGRRTALVERRWLGGSCPNIACLPSKNLIHSAKVASLAQRGREFGVEMDSLRINMAGVQL